VSEAGDEERSSVEKGHANDEEMNQNAGAPQERLS